MGLAFGGISRAWIIHWSGKCFSLGLLRAGLLLVLSVIVLIPPAQAYSQFTHEELIDLVWADSILPLLLQRFPHASEAALNRAHAFAYGGSLIQDVGYYPFGNRFFSNLAHYVRSGDFVLAMLHSAHTIDELAFAIGALSHYIGDSIGHSQAVNPATADEFPKVEEKFGPIVTFEEAPVDHIRAEFGFDVTQSAWHRYAPSHYRKRFGFRVARPLLYLAFRQTYGISPRGILGPVRTGLPSYRWSITRLLPAFLGAEMVRLRGHLPPEPGGPAESEFMANVSHSEYRARHRDPYRKPGVGAHALAVVVAIIPKIGVLKILDAKAPDSQTENLFLASADVAVTRFREATASLRATPDPTFDLENLDLDTGKPVVAGRSPILDRTYAMLLFRVVRQPVPPSPALRRILLDYFSNLSRASPGSHDDELVGKIEEALAILR
jgi:zinc dependent phospholipase C